jgi:hypothetical protein
MATHTLLGCRRTAECLSRPETRTAFYEAYGSSAASLFRPNTMTSSIGCSGTCGQICLQQQIVSTGDCNWCGVACGRKEGPLQGEKHIINSRRDVETGSIETGTPGRLQVLVRERGKVRLKHWYASSPVRDPPPSFNSRTELVIKLWN